jgi:hypothetical protein
MDTPATMPVRSITTTRFLSSAALMAAFCLAGPLPITTKS